MVIKVSDELLKSVGATGAADFSEKLTAYVANAQNALKFMAENSASLDSIQAAITELKGSMLTEDRVKAIFAEQFTAQLPGACQSFLAGETGKSVIEAAASKKTMEIMGAVGTTPAKPSPAPAAGSDTPEQKAATLIAEGKFEEAFPLLPASERADFMGPKSYAAYMRHRGQIKITAKN